MKINNEWTWCMYILEPREWWSLWWRKDSVSSSSTVSARRSYTASVVQSHWINITEVDSILSKLIRVTLARHRTWWADELAQSWVEFTHHQSMKLWKAVAATLKKGVLAELRPIDEVFETVWRPRHLIIIREREKYFFRQNNLTLLEGLSFFIIRREKCPHLLIHLSNLKQALHQLVIIIHISLTNRCNSSCVLYVFFPVCELHFLCLHLF